MESIQLFASLYAKETRTSLQIFQRAIACLEAGEKLFSAEFLNHCPELFQLSQKHSPRFRQEVRDELMRSEDRGNQLLYPGHPRFPNSYLELEEIPFLIRLKGDPAWLKRPGLAIVGCREPSYLSKLWMDRHLGAFLKRRPCFTVSGGARGVDQKAHLVSLLMGRPTVVLLPSGLENIYPTSMLELQQEILKQGGAFLSEYEDQKPMQKHCFVQRNRLISGLAKATLVVEARWKSGTMVTALEAADQGRPVWVLPGHPMDPLMQGSLQLISEGAAMIRDAEDLYMQFSSEIHEMTEDSEASDKDLGSVQLSLH